MLRTRAALLLPLLLVGAPLQAQEDFVYGVAANPALQSMVLNGTTVLTAVDQGFYREIPPHHIFRNTNYIVGQCCSTTPITHRNFFVFDIPVGITIFSAALRLNTFNVVAPPNLVRYFDYTGSITDLLAGSGGTAAFEDLGSGAVYGSRTYTAADANQVRDIPLNGLAVGAINSAAGGRFALGGSLSTVPEPVSLALLGTGLAGLAVARRGRRKEERSGASGRG